MAAQVRQVVTRVGVAQDTPLGIEDGVEAGDEHVLRDACQQRLVDLLKYLPGRGGVQGLSGELQHAAGGGHNKRCWRPLAGGVPRREPQAALREEMEVVEVS